LKKSIGSSKIVVEETNNGGEKPMLYLDDIKVEFESQGFKRTHIGGNIYTENKDGINVHKYGAHIFHT
jgi:hypothetical protein